jgi:hypothetical protein
MSPKRSTKAQTFTALLPAHDLSPTKAAHSNSRTVSTTSKMCGETKCLFSDECARSKKRVEAGKTYCGENHKDWNILKQYAMPSELRAHDDNCAAQIALLDSDNPLSQKVTDHIISKNPCTICKRADIYHSKMDMSMDQPRIILKQSWPAYVASSCDHAFHEACLFSYLTEPSEQCFSKCNKCGVILASVHIKGFNALTVAEAMDRIERRMAKLSVRPSAAAQQLGAIAE